MKRLIFVLCAVMLLLGPGVVIAEPAKPAIIKLDAGSFIGMTEETLVTAYGSPARVEPSEYGFQWYVYNGDYKNFFMAGVQNGSVVGFYTNGKTLTYNGQFALNSTKDAVRAVLGKPMSYIRQGNTIFILNTPKQKDYFPVGDNYVIVYYDTVKDGKVTSIQIVPKALEDSAYLSHPALTADLEAAYQRLSVDLINAIRVRSGLRALKTDNLDTKLAVSRSQDMRDRNYFSHYTPQKVSPFTQAKRMGIKYKSMGENIAFGNHNAIITHEAFMNSSGHRKNVLKSVYTKIGAGVAYGSKRYVLVTNIFTN